jgi:site-specific recombinase XerD
MDRILAAYTPGDAEGGPPRPQDVSDEDNMVLAVLAKGAQRLTFEPTVAEAFDLYLKEKVPPDPYKRKKQVERFRRIEADAIRAFGGNLKLTDIRRTPHANDLRDLLLERMSPDSAKRQINDLKAALNFAAREFEVDYQDRFARLNWPQSNELARDKRHPLPGAVVAAVYADLARTPLLLRLWTLLHHTGAQGAEVLGLKVGEVCLDAAVPHIAIRPRGERSVKDGWRVRNVPLVGAALAVAEVVTRGRGPEEDIFPRYADTAKHGTFSQTMNKRLRKHTDDRRHTTYSLRHTMKDALREAGVGQGLENAILGHALSGGVDANYGHGYSLAAKRDALLAAVATEAFQAGLKLPNSAIRCGTRGHVETITVTPEGTFRGNVHKHRKTVERHRPDMIEGGRDIDQ